MAQQVMDRPTLQQFRNDHEVKRLLESINSIDLSMVRFKLMNPDEGESWSGAYCVRVEAEYRRYLALNRAYPEKAIVPSKIVDKVWHAHILDTHAYAKDCEQVFGSFVHHFPYMGTRGDEDARNLQRAYAETLQLYEEHFGVPPTEFWAPADASGCPNCKGGCKS